MLREAAQGTVLQRPNRFLFAHREIQICGGKFEFSPEKMPELAGGVFSWNECHFNGDMSTKHKIRHETKRGREIVFEHLTGLCSMVLTAVTSNISYYRVRTND